MERHDAVAYSHRKVSHCNAQGQLSYSFYGRRAMAGFVEVVSLQFYCVSRLERKGSSTVLSSYSSICAANFDANKLAEV